MAFINIKFPLQDDKETNFFLKRTTSTAEAIKSNLIFLFTTNKRERFYNREYGSNLKKDLFEPNDTRTASDIETNIRATVSKFIPNVNVDKILFDDKSVENGLLVTVYFTFEDGFYSFSDVIAINF